MFKTVLGTYNKNEIITFDKELINSYPYGPDMKIIEGKKGFFLLLDFENPEYDNKWIIKNFILLSDEEYLKFTK